jgi:hypothetical protein
VPIYARDPIVRRAPALQLTADARPPRSACRASSRPSAASSTATRCASAQGGAQAVLPARVDPTLAPNACACAGASAHRRARADVRRRSSVAQSAPRRARGDAA